ncbi:MAG TPA: porin family protein [Bacteroidia bacterium]|nr:porin family protein [Bacteroidia bacterium]
MKKLIVLALLAVCAAKGFGQAANAFAYKKYRFSFSAMPLVSWMRPDTKNLTNEGMRMGISAGLTAERNFSTNAAFTFGVYVTQMGGKVGYGILQANGNGQNPNLNPVFNNVEYTYKTRYVEIPLMLKLRTDEFGYSRVFGEFGAALNFLWRGRADLNQPVFSDAQGGSEDRNVNEATDDFDAATSSVNKDNLAILRVPLVIGGGWEYAMSENTALYAGLRYNASLINVMRADNTKAFSSYIGLNLGILF